ncbi:hypothetical protein AGLY_003190 [Aphis glycines]|uniref:Uncharacterized protein n=1 Tax=Aphis glycines TaxID=307491 RepID=A0A6G0U3S7_APHGL|nr:hypothetical protein AGLY_003190 [Aphis glycines]
MVVMDRKQRSQVKVLVNRLFIIHNIYKHGRCCNHYATCLRLNKYLYFDFAQYATKIYFFFLDIATIIGVAEGRTKTNLRVRQQVVIQDLNFPYELSIYTFSILAVRITHIGITISLSLSSSPLLSLLFIYFFFSKSVATGMHKYLCRRRKHKTFAINYNNIMMNTFGRCQADFSKFTRHVGVYNTTRLRMNDGQRQRYGVKHAPKVQNGSGPD